MEGLPFPPTSDIAKRALAFLNYFRDFSPHFASATYQIRLFAHSKPCDIDQAESDFIAIKNDLIAALPLQPVPINVPIC